MVYHNPASLNTFELIKQTRKAAECHLHCTKCYASFSFVAEEQKTIFWQQKDDSCYTQRGGDTFHFFIPFKLSNKSFKIIHKCYYPHSHL